VYTVEAKNTSCLCYFHELAVRVKSASVYSMSRRSRQRQDVGESRWIGKVMLGLLVLSFVSIGVGYGLMRGYLHSDAFRKFLSVKASVMAGVNGEFAAFRWEGLEVSTDKFEATGDGPVTHLRADDLHTEIGFGGVTRGVWDVRGSSVRRLDIAVDSRKKAITKPAISDVALKEKFNADNGWFPSQANLQEVDVRELAMQLLTDQGSIAASGMRVRAERAGAQNAYRVDVKGGTIQLPIKWISDLQLDRAHLRLQGNQFFLLDSAVNVWSDGRIQTSGELDMVTNQFSLEGDVAGIKCEDVLNSDWSKRLTGNIGSTFILTNKSGFPSASGRLSIENGVLTAMPVLEALAAYADTRRLRVLSLNQAHTEWQWKRDELILKNMVLSSEGLVHLEGSITIRGQTLDGDFRLGIAPGTLSSIPGAETDVFAPGERGLLWTPLHISGTLDHPKEDLTDRMIQAAGMRMFEQLPETGEKVIKFTNAILGDPSQKTVEKGLKIIKESKKTLHEFGGILEGILGGGRRSESDEESKPQ